MLILSFIISAEDEIFVEDRDFVGVVESIKRILISEEHKVYGLIFRTKL